MEENETPENGSQSEETLLEKDKNSALHASLTANRQVLVVDEEGQRRDETVTIINTILPNADVFTADSTEDAEGKMQKSNYDTFVINLLMPGYSSSNFVKAVHNDPRHPLMVGFSADKMSDAYDPKKGIKVKPLRKLFEINTPSNGDSGNTSDPEDEE